MEKAIQKAIKGGWKKDWYFNHFNNDEVAFGDTKQDSENNPCHYLNRGQILLDPLFWSCLGKSLGWCQEQAHFDSSVCKPWKHYWHSFIDHLAENKDPEEFFNNLTK